MNSVEKVKALCKKHGTTMHKVEMDLGFANGYIGGLRKGTIPSDRLAKIATYFGLPIEELLNDDSAEYINYSVNRGDVLNVFKMSLQSIPMLGEIACGEPILMDDSHAELYSGIGMSVKADFCLKCKGDSMVNARIHDGDIVFIKKDEPVEDGQIYAVAIDDEATLKRVYRSENTVTLVAENPTYAPIVVTGTDAKNVRILGKAVAFQSIVR